MREILFRGKRTDNGEWLEGMLARYNSKIFEVANIVNELDILVPVDIRTVGQYTGLADKNGRKIFEGDVVRVTHKGSSYVARIEWDKGGFWVSNPDVQIPDMLANIKTNYIEVIDNPELLEVSENESKNTTD